MGLLIKERKVTCYKCCKESQKGEEVLLIIAEELRTQGSKDDRNRQVLVKGLRRFKKMREEKEEH